ncbi:MAG: hypothetical protein WC091_23540 [Sulfuricellaceae bacterium]
MAKSNAERQAEFRAKMKAEGKVALPLWVTPQEATKIRIFLAPSSTTTTAPDISLPVTKSAAPPNSLLLVTSQRGAFVVPPLPENIPEPFVRDIREAETRAKKKRQQIQKLESELAATEQWIIKTIAELNRLEPVGVTSNKKQRAKK